VAATIRALSSGFAHMALVACSGLDIEAAIVFAEALEHGPDIERAPCGAAPSCGVRLVFAAALAAASLAAAE